jgi:hypothetical protein
MPAEFMISQDKHEEAISAFEKRRNQTPTMYRKTLMLIVVGGAVAAALLLAVRLFGSAVSCRELFARSS